MKISILFWMFLSIGMCIEDDIDIKVTYYEKLIDNAIQKAKIYQQPTDNSAYFRQVSQDVEDYGTFDFIVVGAGSAGSVVASRLSEEEHFNVLLLEAGGWDDDLTDIPSIAGLTHISDRDWGYYTTPQENGCFGWKGRKCPYKRGKLVGGSGSINGLVYARGNKGDYDEWASLGNPGWSFEDVLPYFKKLENFESDDIDVDYRGFAGPVNSIRNEDEGYFDMFSGQLSEIGLEIIKDYNAKQQIGASKNQKQTKQGKRVSGATAYVRPSITRHNLNVTVRALVTKILINPFTKTAYGVEFIKYGLRYRAIAKREVVLSAGAINTPQLLMLSGIGPTDELQKHDIPIIENLPVGKELKDHFILRISFKYNRTIEYVSFRDALRDFLRGKGILTRAGNGFGFSFVNTRDSSSSVPNIEYSFYHPSSLNKTFPSQSDHTDEFLEYQKQLSGAFTLDLGVYVLHPKSSGTLTLQSNSIIDYPLIDLGIFLDKEDMEIFFEGIQFIVRIGETQLAKKENSTLLKFPLCNRHSENSKKYWLCALKYQTDAGLHASTTAKMAPRSDPFAVVDYKLRVYGISGLRVADCSIMPTPVSGHNNPAAFMIGEKAAAMIKSDNGA